MSRIAEEQARLQRDHEVEKQKQREKEERARAEAAEKSRLAQEQAKVRAGKGYTVGVNPYSHLGGR